MSNFSLMTSTILPLPSSPHWAPRMTADCFLFTRGVLSEGWVRAPYSSAAPIIHYTWRNWSLPVNCAFQFHNSFLRQFERREDGTGYLLLHGHVHRMQSELFQPGQECGFQFVRIHFTGMHVNGPIVLDEYCLKGSVSLDGHLPDGMIYL